MRLDEDLKQYEAVLLNGCAVLGAAHLGFMLTLEHEKKLRFLKVISGVSIGSIVALFYLAKIPLNLVASRFREITFASLLRPLHSLGQMVQEMGYATTEKILTVCHTILQEYNLDLSSLTFKDLRRRGRQADLIIVSSRYIGGERIYEPSYFSSKATPNMLVIDAIRLSISIPFLFTTPTYDGHQYTDGVLTDELPFDYVVKHYGIEVDNIIAHAPKMSSKSMQIQQKDWQSVLLHLMQFTLSRLRERHQCQERVIATNLTGQLFEMNAPPEVIDYYVGMGIKSTRSYLRRRYNTNHQVAS